MKKNIILDFDSTLVTIEGIDEMARIKGVYEQIKTLTDKAMNGLIPLENVFAQRLALIKPTTTDLDRVAELYLNSIVKDAGIFIQKIQPKHHVFVVTGGYAQAILPTTRRLGIKDDCVFANHLQFDQKGDYCGFDQQNPLWRNDGKAQIVKQIQKKFPFETFIIGDGMGDAEAKTNGEVFIQFRGVVNREAVAKKADHFALTFQDKVLDCLIE